jgi:hypothetical protein
MPLYKLTKGSIGLIIDGENVDIEKGDTIELSEEVAKRYKYLKRVGQPVQAAVMPVSKDNSTGGEIARDWSHTQNMKAPDVVTLINETNSVDELSSLQQVEENGQNRVGVLKVIEKRIGQLE